jgi:hypothetical protein
LVLFFNLGRLSRVVYGAAFVGAVVEEVAGGALV